MSNYKKQVEMIIKAYRKSGQPWPASTAEMAAWAVGNGRYDLPKQIVDKICARDMAQVLREEYFEDSKGRRVRAKHPARFKSDGEQKVMWHDIREAPRGFMVRAFQLRRNHIVGECRQAKTDVDSYNDAHPREEPIQLPLDFTWDVAELQGKKVKEFEHEEFELEEDELEAVP